MNTMTYKGYIGQVTLDEEAAVFHGQVMNTRDVITFQGRTVKELRKALKDSIEDYLAFCAERGEDPDKPLSGKFVLTATASRRGPAPRDDDGSSRRSAICR